MINENALKERLKVIAATKATTMNIIWKQLLLERFLARLSVSTHQNKFIFKGGYLLAQYIAINRETLDIDFMLTKLKAETKNIQNTISDIISIDIHDGFYFKWDSIKELTQPHMEYSGFRIMLMGGFGKMAEKIQIDIGIGDAVTPIKTLFFPFEYKGKPIFTGEISLQVYPPESIFSEKLETIISKGLSNSRMKDYHDLLIMIREPNFLKIENITKTIDATFKRRNTKYSSPLQISNEYASTLQPYWLNHLRGLNEYRNRLNFPDNLSDAILEINKYLHGLSFN